MKTKIFTAAYFSLFLSLLFPQTTLKRAELNPDFIKYNKTLKKTGSLTNYVPPPYIFASPVPENIEILDFPRLFDWRELGMITSVKDQKDLDLCWAFSSIGAAEAQYLRYMFPGLSLSEELMAEFKAKLYKINGGNASMSSSYYSSLNGPVVNGVYCDPNAPGYRLGTNFQDVPYPVVSVQDESCNINYRQSEVIPKSAAAGSPFSKAKNLNKITGLDTLRNLIKKKVYENGALTTAFYWDYAYYNQDDFTYFCDNNDEPVNHSVLIVGWDDDKATAASAPGAWIIKNSWGMEFGEDGYFYLSYYDSVALRHENAQWTGVKLHNQNSHLYMNDELGGISMIGFPEENTSYGLAKFESINNMPISQIMTWTTAGNAEVSIRIYDDFDGANLSNLLSQSLNIYREYPGYSMYKLPGPLVIPQGDDFYVCIEYKNPEDYNYPIPAEHYIENYCDPNIVSGKFWCSSDSQNWIPVGADTDLKYNLSIRAYAEHAAVEQDILVSVDSLIFNIQQPVEKHFILDEDYSNKNSQITKLQGSKLSKEIREKTILFDEKKASLSKPNSDLDTLLYDDGTVSGFYHWGAGARMGTRMTPAEACKLKAVQIACFGEQDYKIGIYDWTDSKPGAEIYESEIVTSPGQVWHTTNIEAENIYLDKDFVVSFNMLDTSAAIGYNPSNNGRSWDFNGSQWSSWSETYLVRAIVEYEAGNIDTISNFTISNNGGLYLTVSNFESNVSWMSSVDPYSFVIAPGESQEVMVSINSAGLSNDVYYGDLKIFSNDPDESPYILPVKLINNNIVSVDEEAVVTKYFLSQNYPNPFNPTTTINYSVPENQKVSLKVFDILGREIYKLVDEEKTIGNYEVKFTANNLSSGIYFYRMQAGEFIETKKLMLLK